jgi:hypothetical protein
MTETGLQATNGSLTRFLGARGLMVTAEEAEALGVSMMETEEPKPLDLVKLVLIGLGAGLIVYLILTRRKKRVRRNG